MTLYVGSSVDPALPGTLPLYNTAWPSTTPNLAWGAIKDYSTRPF
jgi:hypothetical protein